jgi:hypothetical protein
MYGGFSKPWRNRRSFFQGLENIAVIFSHVWKIQVFLFPIPGKVWHEPMVAA